ncbi:MAG: sigma-54 dependent transcriptional regulator [Gemmatimonadota bacterium]|nr:sigma-54 dependent transcriptional regulator [Gemmatimonadota bacterium]
MDRKVLLVDDDPDVLRSLSRALETRHFHVRTAPSAQSALAAIAADPPHIVLSDVRMPSVDGIELLQILRSRVPDIHVILMSGHDDLPVVSKAMGEGAADFLVKPLDLNQLWSVVERVLDEPAPTPADSDVHEGPDPIRPRLVGGDPRMVEAFKVAGRLARTSTNVLVRGEGGVGKEFLARFIHDQSERAGDPFVVVRCASLSRSLLEVDLFGHVRGAMAGVAGARQGQFEAAGAGTIFLDEIGRTSIEVQSALMSVLEEKEFRPVGSTSPIPVRARVIAATHRNLGELVAAGSFREDLYYLLRVVEIYLPPLRDRMGDLTRLADHLVAQACRSLGSPRKRLSPESMEALRGHTWPGNVRELNNCLTRAAVVCTGATILPEHLTLTPDRDGSSEAIPTLAEVERRHVERVLTATRGRKTRTAAILGISRPRLDRLIRKYGLGPHES